MTVRAFYDDLAARYHLVYQDWDASIARQAAGLDSLLREFFPGAATVVDVAVGIGTQSLGLRSLGYEMVGSDLSVGALHRATAEARGRAIQLPVYAADFGLLPLKDNSVPVILCADNSLPHAASTEAMRLTLAEWYRCVQPGGGCIISMRDYREPGVSGSVEEHSYGTRLWNGHQYALAQQWTWHDARYDVSLTMTALDEGAEVLPPITTSYLAISPGHVLELMREVGFESPQRLDGRLFQPVLIGFKSAPA